MNTVWNVWILNEIGRIERLNSAWILNEMYEYLMKCMNTEWNVWILNEMYEYWMKCMNLNKKNELTVQME